MSSEEQVKCQGQITGPNMYSAPAGGGGGGGTPLFGLYGDVPLDRVWFFELAVLNNLTCLCPKQGIVFRAERLKLRLRAVSFFS